MSEMEAIATADLSSIESSLSAIECNLDSINSDVDTVNDNVKIIYNQVDALTKDFHDFIEVQYRANKKQVAHTELVRIRQELEKKYGHYDLVRRTTVGILQADDLGIIRKETMNSSTEEIMISTPGYWLAPALVALSAWISDQRELAEKATKEAIRRNDEKTSLFFLLVCRRAGRKEASLKWLQRYLENQNEEKLDRKCIIVIDAFVSGLLGTDSEGIVYRQIDSWLNHLSNKPGFVEQQTQQWSDAINLKRTPIEEERYPYLRRYSASWDNLENIMEGAELNATIYEYFNNIFEKEITSDSLKKQLDEILTSLVTDYDDEELPLRKEEKFQQFVIDFEGDVDRARKNMAIEQSAFETTKDFTQLLTDAAMKSESAHASAATQKFAIALSKDWIIDAYNDVVAQNRSKIPDEIDINVDTFNGTTKDGENEEEILNSFRELIQKEKKDALKKCVLSIFDYFCLCGGIFIALIGFMMILSESNLFSLVVCVAGIGMIVRYFSRKKQIATAISNIDLQFKNKQEAGEIILRGILAEVVDFRSEFAMKDQESEKVITFLEQISAEQYVRKLADSTRRIRIMN